MWTPLQHPYQIEFFQELQRECLGPTQDWIPMIQAILHVQSQAYAEKLYAFTSLVHFCITTAPCYDDSENHPVVGITWSCRDRHFRLSFGKKGADAEKEVQLSCEPEHFPAEVDALIQRLLMEPRGN